MYVVTGLTVPGDLPGLSFLGVLASPLSRKEIFQIGECINTEKDCGCEELGTRGMGSDGLMSSGLLFGK